MENKTIKWFKVECSFYDQPIGIQHWDTLLEFMSRHICFDYVIKGQTSQPFIGVDVEYRDGKFYNL